MWPCYENVNVDVIVGKSYAMVVLFIKYMKTKQQQPKDVISRRDING